MRTQLIKSTNFFQELLVSQFCALKQRLVKTIMLLSLCHLFGLYNPNQDTESEPISAPERSEFLSLAALICAYRLFCGTTVKSGAVESKSASTRSRSCHAQCG